MNYQFTKKNFFTKFFLSSLQDILWENEDRWKKVTMADMLSAAQVKKCYRKASIIVHPDKVAGQPHERLAHEIQMVLNKAWADFEEHGAKSQGPTIGF